MRAEFEGGACDGHSHSVGPVPPADLGAPCRSAVRGRYVRAEARMADAPDASRPGAELIVYRWHPGEAGKNPTAARLSSVLGLEAETG